MRIRHAAFAALSNIPLSQIDVSNVPTRLSKFLEVKSKNNDDQSREDDTNQPLTGQDICNLILHYPNECFQGKHLDGMFPSNFYIIILFRCS